MEHHGHLLGGPCAADGYTSCSGSRDVSANANVACAVTPERTGLKSRTVGPLPLVGLIHVGMRLKHAILPAWSVSLLEYIQHYYIYLQVPCILAC